MRRLPFSDEPVFPVDGNVGFVAKERNGQIRCGDHPVILLLRLRELFSVHRA